MMTLPSCCGSCYGSNLSVVDHNWKCVVMSDLMFDHIQL